MIVTPENSMELYRNMVANPPNAPEVPMKVPHEDPYKQEGRDVVSIVKTDSRVKGIRKAVELLGGIKALTRGVK